MISALILAAGKSTRMGRPKMALPWGDTTVLGHVINVFRAAEVEDVLVVGGGHTGLGRGVRACCHTFARLLSSGALDSLNASVAAGIALHTVLVSRTSPKT